MTKHIERTLVVPHLASMSSRGRMPPGARVLVACALATGALLVTSARAANIVVDSLDDELNSDGDCSLREALAAANGDTAVDACASGAGADLVTLPAGVVDAQGGPLSITSELTLRGSEASILATTITLGASPVEVSGAVAVIERVRLTGATSGALVGVDADVTLRRAHVDGNAGGAGAVTMTLSAGPRPRLVVEDSHFSANVGAPALAVGAGRLTVRRTTFSGTAGGATAGAVLVNGSVADGDGFLIESSTFSGNATTGAGGAIAAHVPGVVDHCSFIENTAGTEGGALLLGALPQVRSSLFVGNDAPDGATCKQLVPGSVSAGFNVFDDDTGCPLLEAGDTSTAAPLAQIAAPLAEHGGAAPTHALVAGSPAIDAAACVGVDGNAAVRDQRGAERLDNRCDAGAFELGARFLVSLARVQPEPPGATCAGGGSRMELGMDDGDPAGVAGNGFLDDGEVDDVVFVCEQPAAQVLVSVEDDDGTCADGGVQVHSGVDDDRDGVLDVAERDRTDHVCNGAAGADGSDGANGPPGTDGAEGPGGPAGADGDPGAPGATSLVRLSEVRQGESGCVAGGQRVDTGIDDGAGGATAGDGVLDDGEVDSSAVICHGAAFEDEFETSGGPTCASTGRDVAGDASALATLLALSAGLSSRRRSRRR